MEKIHRSHTEPTPVRNQANVVVSEMDVPYLFLVGLSLFEVHLTQISLQEQVLLPEH